MAVEAADWYPPEGHDVLCPSIPRFFSRNVLFFGRYGQDYGERRADLSRKLRVFQLPCSYFFRFLVRVWARDQEATSPSIPALSTIQHALRSRPFFPVNPVADRSNYLSSRPAG